jgi:L-ascorbate metabolism protein UlaG (beta-lactamase superfamily)
MRITLLGHACLLIETADVRILCDPVFGDSFWDDMATPCPRRELRPEALPSIDVLFLSHHHTDHFDIATLHALRGRVDTVVCPRDEVIGDALRRLGYRDVRALGSGMGLSIGTTQLALTPSRLPVPEHGLLVSDPNARVWNQVDTVFSAEWAGLLARDGRPVDVHFAAFDPVNPSSVFDNGIFTFPYRIYEEVLATVRAVGARVVVPASSGLAFRGEFAFLNRYSFALRHERFARDLRSVAPGVECPVLAAGDAIAVTGGQARVERQAAGELARAVDRDAPEPRSFAPTGPLPALIDRNPFDRTRRALDAAVDAVLARVDAALRAGSAAHAATLRCLRSWQARMAIAVRYPDDVRSWAIDFTADAPRLAPGGDDANYCFEVTASALDAVERGLWWDRLLSAETRSFHTLYIVRDEGLSYPRPVLPGEPPAPGHVPSPASVFLALWGQTHRTRVERRLADVLGEHQKIV